MDPTSLVNLFVSVADAIGDGLEGLQHWGLVDGSDQQYGHDVMADEIALDRLLSAGLGVVSEETGVHGSDRSIIAVVDPIDGSTNASHGLPYFNTSIAAVDDDGLLVGVVKNQVTGRLFTAIRGQGAQCDGAPAAVSGVDHLSDAIVLFNDLPPGRLGWRQFRVLGASALDLCQVARGGMDAFVDASAAGNSPWDYLAGTLICREAGGTVVDLAGGDLLTTDHGAKRYPIAAATPQLADQLVQRMTEARP